MGAMPRTPIDPADDTDTVLNPAVPIRSSAELLPQAPAGRSQLTSLPRDFETDGARRLRVVVALYAFAFLVSGPITALLSPDERVTFFGSALRWVPSLLSLAAALAVTAFTWNPRVPTATLLGLGLIFEVAGSYGIAAAQYLNAERWTVMPPWGGLSWVAVWMLGFAMMVPSPPRLALLAALGSATAVPAIVAFAVTIAPEPTAITASRYFLQVLVPYLIVVVIADVGARVIYRLGTELKRARELGAYHLVERLGSGGMGDVWRAEHRLLARPAAVKVIRADAARTSPSEIAELEARFEREAQAIASLRSPHTIQLYDFGVAADGRFYYVMELLEGLDLHVLVQRFGPTPVPRAVHLLKQVCHSLAEAHGAGLVHRDIKPANVFVCRYGGDLDFVKVLDFGLVKPVARPVQTTTLSGVHSLRGTPAFMAPEQVLGVHAVDARTDVYAVGCLAYWLISGEMVFTGRTAMETITLHAHEPPLPLSRRTSQPVPDALDRLLLACLDKDPARRPANGAELGEQLAALMLAERWTKPLAREWWEVFRSEK
jgi:serine/threonine-protein kinase